MPKHEPEIVKLADAARAAVNGTPDTRDVPTLSAEIEALLLGARRDVCVAALAYCLGCAEYKGLDLQGRLEAAKWAAVYRTMGNHNAS